MTQKKKETDATYWHPAFYAGIQIELEDDADNLVFENEHQLGKKPMEIDVLIIKKETDRPVKKNIGRIFKKYNIIEYKSPDDSLSVDDFYKVYGYTCFYKADVQYTDSIPAEELSITFVSGKYPRKMIKHLTKIKKYQVTEVEKGIYYVNGDFIPIQILVTKNLSGEENLWLKSLTNKLKATETAEKLVKNYMDHKDSSLHRSVIETIMRANQKIFREVNGMSDIFMEIVQEKFDRKLKEEVEKATVENTVKTKLTERISLIQKKCAKNKPLSVIADELETDMDEILSLYDIISRNPDKTTDEIYQMVAG
ncbi:hypothetical protein EBB54_22430 [Schaedlerella arabinosiphila]|uniref:3-isopropylmalate dehydrogenase n=1 Tax=Schaedlerella arabinosiphila TaxID=2044587 RepID=A0A3R8JR40_9FIRM|nr:hypothetical protein [Schaedlerella arabinosiphila]RRK33811.1 hypothetical protein EBB54_22430 [Schaedlerella arabinosiphila]